MTIQGELALAKAYEEEIKKDSLFQEKCDYHDSLMNKYFFNKGWTFKNCYIDNNPTPFFENEKDVPEKIVPLKYKEEVQKIFDKIGKMMERKFPK